MVAVLSLLDQAKFKGVAPSLEAVSSPSSLEQDGILSTAITAVIVKGASRVTSEVALQPLSSVTVTW